MKYLTLIKITWAEMLSYRFNFTMWRVRLIFQLITMYFFWLAMIPQSGSLFGYSQSLMLTYILGTSLMSSIVFSSRTHTVGDIINRGNLSNYLLKPMSFFFYWFSMDIGDKFFNIAFSIVELTLLILILKPDIFLQQNISIILLTIIAASLALIIYFFFNLMISFIGFWSPEVWAPRFIFSILIGFFAGSIFPLDILPRPLFEFFQLTPFPYLLYFPLKIYLGQIPYPEILRGITTSLVWAGILYTAAHFAWMKGLKGYTAQGR